MSDLISEVATPVLESTPGKSLIQEIQLLREQVQQLCQATQALVKLQSIANQKLDFALKGGIGADFAVLG